MDFSEILQRLNIKALSQMQKRVINAVEERKDDILVLSPTGSGKTLAYLLPLVGEMECGGHTVQSITIVPNRELAQQQCEVLKSLKCGVTGMALYGGRMAMEEHREIVKQEPQIVFATPGRLKDHLEKGNIRAESVKFIVIDEFDKCLEMGFLDEMKAILEMLPVEARHILLSATESQEIPQFVNIHRLRRIDFQALEEEKKERIKTLFLRSQEKDKLRSLSLLLRNIKDETSIVFLNFRDSVERTNAFLKSEGFTTSCFHGGMTQEEREDALFRFQNGSTNVLVCTDLASRGLDIPEVGNIIHYHLPLNEESYIHRTGRTARWEASGKSIFILSKEECPPPYIKDIEEMGGLVDNLQVSQPKMATLYIGKGKRDKLSKGDIMGFLCKTGGLAGGEIGNISLRERYAYAAVKREKAKQAVSLCSGKKIKGIKTVVEPII